MTTTQALLHAGLTATGDEAYAVVIDANAEVSTRAPGRLDIRRDELVFRLADGSRRCSLSITEDTDAGQVVIIWLGDIQVRKSGVMRLCAGDTVSVTWYPADVSPPA